METAWVRKGQSARHSSLSNGDLRHKHNGRLLYAAQCPNTVQSRRCVFDQALLRAVCSQSSLSLVCTVCSALTYFLTAMNQLSQLQVLLNQLTSPKQDARVMCAKCICGRWQHSVHATSVGAMAVPRTSWGGNSDGSPGVLRAVSVSCTAAPRACAVVKTSVTRGRCSTSIVRPPSAFVSNCETAFGARVAVSNSWSRSALHPQEIFPYTVVPSICPNFLSFGPSL